MQGVCIRIDKGEGFSADPHVSLVQGEMIIGRSRGEQGYKTESALYFPNPYISRRHARIQEEDGHYSIMDLNSKHGVSVNGMTLEKNQSFPLNHRDSIELAKGIIELTFLNANENNDLTRELDFSMIASRIHVDRARRQVTIDGKRLALSGKHMELLLCLYEKRNQAVSYKALKRSVWSERLAESDEATPDVGKEEINALVYRLRQKLGEYGKCIVTIPRYGYMLEIEKN